MKINTGDTGLLLVMQAKPKSLKSWTFYVLWWTFYVLLWTSDVFNFSGLGFSFFKKWRCRAMSYEN